MNQKISMPEKPNVIWIFGDQMRGQTLSCNGETNIVTPNLDQLALRGVNFPNARAGFPLCCPFRGSLLTGLYPHKSCPGHDMGMPPEKPTIANVMKESGYHTAYFGKWHLDFEGGEKKVAPNRAVFHIIPPERRGGFNCFRGYQNNNDPWDCYVHGGEEGNEIEPTRLEGYETDGLTDILIDYMDEKKDTPFFAVLSVMPPHHPYVAPEHFMDGINSNTLELRKNVPQVPWVERQARRELAGYYAAIKNLDYNVGRIVKALDRLHLSDNTYIVFFSDHGDSHGSHGAFHKMNPYEESLRIPFIISTGRGCMYSISPSLLYGTNGSCESDAPVNHVDIAPTTLGLCNIPKPDWMEGYDYSGYIKSPKPLLNEPDSAFLQCNQVSGNINSIDRPWRGIVTKDGWKYIAVEGEPWMLFNLVDDPYEQMNMVHLNNYMPIVKDMNDRLQLWLDKTEDKFRLPEIAVPGIIRTGRGNGVYHGLCGEFHY